MIAIVTDVHYRMSLALIRTLGEMGYTVLCCEREGVSAPLGFHSKYAAQRIVLSNIHYWEELYALCNTQEERPLLVAVGAATLAGLSQRREQFSQVANFLVSPPETLDLLNDKSQSAQLAQRCHIPTPKSHHWGMDIPLPCVVKPLCGEKLGLSAAQRYTIAHTRAQLETAHHHFTQLGTEVVIQQYLEGDGVACSVVAKDGVVCASLCHRRLRQYPISGGPSTCCCSQENPQLVDYATRMVAESHFTGFAMFEFKEDNGVPHFLEVNPRVWGSFPLARTSRSALIQSYVSAATAAPIPENHPIHGKMQFVISDLMAGLSHLKRGQILCFLSVILDFLNPNVKEGLFQWSDPKPFFVYLNSLFSRRSHGD